MCANCLSYTGRGIEKISVFVNSKSPDVRNSNSNKPEAPLQPGSRVSQFKAAHFKAIAN